MKKKVFFIIGTLQSGGVSKSIVNLLKVWDRERYEASLILCLIYAVSSLPEVYFKHVI